MKSGKPTRLRSGLQACVIATVIILIGGGDLAGGGQVRPRQKALRQSRPAGPGASLDSSDFQAISSSVFSGAAYRANSCGGADAVRSTRIVVPGLYDKSEPIGRLDKALPANVRQETMREEISYSDNPPVIRDSEIRACLDDLETHAWLGSIENGTFKIRMQFNSNVFLKTRIMYQENKGSGWKDKFEWRDDITDLNVPDYIYVAPCLDVYLTPAVQNGRLGYSTVDVKWFWAEDSGFVWPQNALVADPFRVPHGHPAEREMILSYKTEVMNAMKQRLASAFQNNAIRDRLSAALTAKVKTGDFAGKTISSVSGTAGTVKVVFD